MAEDQRQCAIYGREGATHLSGDLETLWKSRLLKNYVDSFCTEIRPMILSFVEEGVTREVPGTHGVVTRTRESRSRQVG